MGPNGGKCINKIIRRTKACILNYHGSCADHKFYIEWCSTYCTRIIYQFQNYIYLIMTVDMLAFRQQ